MKKQLLRAELQAKTGAYFHIFYPAKEISSLEKFCLYSNIPDSNSVHSLSNDLYISRTRNLKKAIKIPA